MIRCGLAERPSFVGVVLSLCVLAGTNDCARAQATRAVLAQMKAQKLLEEMMDLKDFRQPMTLKEALELIQDKLNAKYQSSGDVLPVVVDEETFRVEDDSLVLDTQVKFPSFPRQMRIATILRLALSRVPSNNATFLLRNGYVEVTTIKQASVKRLLQRKVIASFERRPLSEAVEELSALTGLSVILDTRLGDALKKPVSATLNNDTPVEGALRFLADMAGASLFVSDEGVYITSPEHAEKLRKERKARLEERRREHDEARRRSANAAGVGEPNRQPTPEKREPAKKEQTPGQPR